MLAAHIALWLSGLVAAATMAAALYTQAPLMRAGRSSIGPAPHETAQSRWSAATNEVEDEPVLVANPFDESEVFEFAQGTSETEARAAVAEVLMARARQRYAQLDPQS